MLKFNFNPAPGTNLRAIEAITAAGNFWSSQFTDDVTLNIDFRFEPAPDFFGHTVSKSFVSPYNKIRAGFASDRTSPDDATAVSNLQRGSTLDLLINYTKDNPKGIGSQTPYLDKDKGANNSVIEITNANAKALKLFAADNPNPDALITFNSLTSWDFERSDGISKNSYDFIGVAIHEIGHAMGFTSGMDILDFNSPLTIETDKIFYPDDRFKNVTTLDLFRFSKKSAALNSGVIDWTTDRRDKYFSIDGGATKIASFSTGSAHGDGFEQSHWKELPTSLGTMDAVGQAAGELFQFSRNDLRAFDVIGWDRSVAVPELASIS